jgi:hypothetical protein
MKNKTLKQDAALVLANAFVNAQLKELNRLSHELHRAKSVAASAYQVVELAMAEPQNSQIAKHLVHCAAVALSTIE